MEQTSSHRSNRARPSVREFFRVALYLGAIGFGGGVSVLATIEAIMVTRRRWLTEKEFNNTATIAQMLPGGAAANALAAVGLRLHGLRGAAAGYVGFILPGTMTILVLAWAYVRVGMVPRADAFLSGLNASVVGIIGAITVKMARTSVGRPWQMGVVAVALLLTLVGGSGPLEVAFVGIGVGLGWDLGVERARLLRFRRKRWHAAPRAALPEEGRPLPRSTLEANQDTAAEASDKKQNLSVVLAGLALPKSLIVLIPLAVVFFRTGLGAYGGGFAIIPALHSQVVRDGWLTEHQFADAVAVGKLTPGPVLLMATFIGYLKEGLLGALSATVSILAAPFFATVTLSAWLARMRSRRWMRAALRGLTPAVVGLMMAAALILGRTMQTGAGLAIAAFTALTLVRFPRVNPVAMLAIGGVLRLALRIAFDV